MFFPSRGASPLDLSPSTPSMIVGNQSLTCIKPFWTVPVTSVGNRGLDTKPIPLRPPSHSVFFSPRKGQLLASHIALPPLSIRGKSIDQIVGNPANNVNQYLTTLRLKLSSFINYRQLKRLMIVIFVIFLNYNHVMLRT